jgi:hypothetical protein
MRRIISEYFRTFMFFLLPLHAPTKWEVPVETQYSMGWHADDVCIADKFKQDEKRFNNIRQDQQRSDR